MVNINYLTSQTTNIEQIYVILNTNHQQDQLERKKIFIVMLRTLFKPAFVEKGFTGCVEKLNLQLKTCILQHFSLLH